MSKKPRSIPVLLTMLARGEKLPLATLVTLGRMAEANETIRAFFTAALNREGQGHEHE
jgi:hypothetical protein